MRKCTCCRTMFRKRSFLCCNNMCPILLFHCNIIHVCSIKLKMSRLIWIYMSSLIAFTMSMIHQLAGISFKFKMRKSVRSSLYLLILVISLGLFRNIMKDFIEVTYAQLPEKNMHETVLMNRYVTSIEAVLIRGHNVYFH